MTDRRRINGPPNGTISPIFASSLDSKSKPRSVKPPGRTRKADELRKTFLKTGFTPSAAGSAYLELERPDKNQTAHSLNTSASSLKLSCTIHGPKPLPRSAPFSSNLQISTYVKFAPFAARERRGYIRDSRERDLSVHLETALKGVIIGDRWPKSGLDVVVTVLEGEGEGEYSEELARGGGGTPGWGMMNVLAGCINVVSAALADARVDCLDLVAGGVAAIVERDGLDQSELHNDHKMNIYGGSILILDPCPEDHNRIQAACVVGYLESKDEITELWVKGDIPSGKSGELAGLDILIQGAVDAASASRTVLIHAVRESAELLVQSLTGNENAANSVKRKALEDDHGKMEE